MKNGKLLIFCTLALVLLLSGARQASAVNAVLSLYDVGNNTYWLDCNAVNDVLTMDITFEYDAGSMENVNAVKHTFIDGRGTLTVIPSTSSSSVRLYASYTPPGATGNGHIAEITYTPKKGRAGNIILLTGTFKNANGVFVPVDVRPIVNPPQPVDKPTDQPVDKPTDQPVDKPTDQPVDKPADQPVDKPADQPVDKPADQPVDKPADQPANKPTDKQTGGLQTQVITGVASSVTVSMPTDATTPSTQPGTSATSDSPSEPGTPLPSVEGATSAEAAAKAASAESSSGILDRFRNYRGERTLQAFAALFKAPTNSGIAQEPWIVLSDGTAKATLLIKGQSSLNYSLQKAKRRSLKKAGENNWQLEVVPEKGTYQAVLLVRQGGSTTTFPLTVAPPVSVTDKDLSVYFVERAKGSRRFDLNSDGVINYIDDYIFTANYLAARQKGASETGKK